MAADLALCDLNPAAPHPKLGSTVTLTGSEVHTSDSVLLGRLPAESVPSPSVTTATVRSVRRAPEGGGLAGVVVRLNTAASAAAAPADDTGARPVARRRGERGRRRRAKKKTFEAPCVPSHRLSLSPFSGLAPPEADLDPDDLRCRLTRADCDALGMKRKEARSAARLTLSTSRPSHLSHLSLLPLHFHSAASPAVRAHLADPAVRAAAARVLAAPPAATEPVLDAELSIAGALGGLGAAVLGELAPNEASLLGGHAPPPRGP